MKNALVLCAAIAMLVTGGAPAAFANDRAQLVEYKRACFHYVNRAKFRDRHDGVDFVVTLADACTSALESLDKRPGAEHDAAKIFLHGLVALRDTIVEMNMSRVFGDGFTPLTPMPRQGGARTRAVRRVSATGEYLIAHRMGLLKAYRAWLDTGPEFAFASRRGE